MFQKHRIGHTLCYLRPTIICSVSHIEASEQLRCCLYISTRGQAMAANLGGSMPVDISTGSVHIRCLRNIIADSISTGRYDARTPVDEIRNGISIDSSHVRQWCPLRNAPSVCSLTCSCQMHRTGHSGVITHCAIDRRSALLCFWLEQICYFTVGVARTRPRKTLSWSVLCVFLC